MGERPWWGQGLRMLRPLAAPAAARFSLGSEATPLAVRPLIASPVVHAGVLDAAECERVKAMAEKRGFSPSNSAYGEADSRRCRSTWLLPEDDAHWLYAKVGACIERANERFGFAVNGFLEPVMVARYGPGDHFDWHLDIGPELAANRKLSVSLLLDPPGEYEGGGNSALCRRVRRFDKTRCGECAKAAVEGLFEALAREGGEESGPHPQQQDEDRGREAEAYERLR